MSDNIIKFPTDVLVELEPVAHRAATVFANAIEKFNRREIKRGTPAWQGLAAAADGMGLVLGAMLATNLIAKGDPVNDAIIKAQLDSLLSILRIRADLIVEWYFENNAP